MTEKLTLEQKEKTKPHLKPESLEDREMMSVNPLGGDWFASNDFVKYDLDDVRGSALASVMESAGDLSEEGVIDVPNEWLIQLGDHLISQTGDVAGATKYFQSLGITVVGGLGAPGALHVHTAGGTAADQSFKLSSIAGITGFEPNQILVSAATNVQNAVNDPLANQLWNLNKVQAADAWNYLPANSPGTSEVIVAVIDTGVNINHPDLKDNIWVNTAELNGKVGVDNTGNGFKNDYYGWNFVDNNNNVLDDHGHGTHVAGTIAAVGDNAIGVVGVAPNAKILPLKALNSAGSGFASDVTKAINYSTALRLSGQNVVAINCSFIFSSSNTAMNTAIINAGNAGIVVVAGAGNNSYNLDVTKMYPASTEAPNVITVGATTSTDAWATYSNYGSAVDVAAPGSSIYSTTMNGGYGLMSGTSMATPHVSGMVALIAATNPNLTPEQIKAAIVQGTDKLPQLQGKVSSGGRVNAANTLALVAGNNTGGGTTTPAPSVTAPTTPTGLAAGTITTNSIAMSWTAVSGATSYKLEAQINGTWTTVYTGSNASYTHAGLTANTTYNYRVSATNTGGTSAASTAASAKTNAVTVAAPTTPTKLAAGSATASSLNVTWTAVSGATSYKLEAQIGGTWTTIYTGSNASFSHTGLTAGTSYSYRISAENAGGFSAVSATVTGKTSALPTAPTKLAAGSATANSLKLTWNAVSGATGYHLEAQINGNWQTVYTGTTASFTHTGLDANTTYNYRVSVTTSVGTSLVSSAVSAKTSNAAPVTPTGLTANATSTSQLNVSWNAVSNAASYTLQVQMPGSTTWTTVYTGSNANFTHSGLTANTQYNYRVSATNAAGSSAVSSTVSATTPSSTSKTFLKKFGKNFE